MKASRNDPREVAVVVGKGLCASRRSLLRIIEKLAPYRLPVLVDSGLPLSSLPAPANADKPGGIIALHRSIARILRMVAKSKVFDAVVRSYSVAMVNFIRLPLGMNEKPRENVSVIIAWLRNLYLDVALDRRSSDRSGVSRVPLLRSICSPFPAKYAGTWFVIKNRSNEFNGQRLSASSCHIWPRSLRHPVVGIPQLPLTCTTRI